MPEYLPWQFVFLAGSPGLDLIVQLHHGVSSPTGDRLVGIDNHAPDRVHLMNGVDGKHKLHSGAIRTGDDAVVLEQVVIIHARDDQRHVQDPWRNADESSTTATPARAAIGEK